MKTAHVSDGKKKVVSDFLALFEQYPIVGAVNLENLPTPQLQQMRALLRSKVVLRVTKRRLMKLAIAKAKAKKPGIEKIEEYLVGMPGLLFTKENPFSLYKTIQKNKSPAPAKAGQTAPRDVVVPAGPTPFAPGPVIGELSSIGIKTGVEGGKIVIKQDAVVVEAGGVINAKVAEILGRLGINPMEVGLDIVAVYEDGTIYKRDVLSIDEKQFMENLLSSLAGAVNLAVFCDYPTHDTIEIMLQNAWRDSRALAVSETIYSKDVMEEIVQKAERITRLVKEELKLS